MTYQKTLWKNRLVERPRTFKMLQNADGSVTLDPAEGQIIEAGTPINAGNLNKIEDTLEAHESHLAEIMTDDERLTEAKDLTGSINELFTNANNGKQYWVDVVGSPLVNTDTFATLKSKTQTLKNTMATNLTEKGQASFGTESLSELINKINELSEIKNGYYIDKVDININYLYKTGQNLFYTNDNNSYKRYYKLNEDGSYNSITSNLDIDDCFYYDEINKYLIKINGYRLSRYNLSGTYIDELEFIGIGSNNRIFGVYITNDFYYIYTKEKHILKADMNLNIIFDIDLTTNFQDPLNLFYSLIYGRYLVLYQPYNYEPSYVFDLTTGNLIKTYVDIQKDELIDTVMSSTQESMICRPTDNNKNFIRITFFGSFANKKRFYKIKGFV